MAQTYKLKVTRGDISIEVEGNKSFVLEIMNKFHLSEAAFNGSQIVNDTNPVSKHKPKSQPTMAESSKKTVSVGEFIRSLEIKKHTDFVIAFGYFLEKYAGKSDFTPADINDAYYDAKLDPSNTSQMIIQNIKRGFLMPAKSSKGQSSDRDKKKRYTLTNSGENYVSKLMSSKIDK